MKFSAFCYFILVAILLQAQTPEPLSIGSQAPTFTGIDQYGDSINLDKLLQNGSVVVVFYRGQWCPHCNRQMAALQDSLRMIRELGATVVAITPEKEEEIQKTINKSDAKFSIIYDENHQIMDRYKVTFELEGTLRTVYRLGGININKAARNEDRVLPVPATYIINKEGIIIGRHFDEDYTVRMPVINIIDVLKKSNTY